MTETMGSDASSGGTRIGGVLGVLGLVAAMSVGAIALSSGTPAAAEGLERFDSCAELEAWSTPAVPPDVAVEDVAAESGRSAAGTGAGVAGGAPASGLGAAGGEVAPPAAPSPVAQDDAAVAATADSQRAAPVDDGVAAGAGAGAGAGDGDGGGDGGDTGGTNTVVEGVDEIDVIDRVGDDRLLVSRNGVIALVDLAGRTVVAEQRGVPYDARISVAGDLVWIAGSAVDGTGTVVQRVRIAGDALVDDGTWRTPGYLQDARRTGDVLHVVAVDVPGPGVAPFAGGPVPCDQVWRPVAPSSEPAATMIASLPADGPLEPTAVAEVTGSAGNLLVTDGAAYIATQTWGGDGTTVTTGIHRFELAGLRLTGSGLVPGTVAGPFAMDEHGGHLRVATNAGSGFGIGLGRAIPVEGDVAVDAAVVDPAPPPGPAGSDVVVDPVPPVAPGDGGGALAEVLVLDLEGDLDVVGRTGRFGHDGETIHGVRFVGDVAYVVTFLRTDPFWVIDLADPAAPTVVGELAIPGFSGYLHPVTADRVVGFGPDGNGRTSVRLFDVADPQAPAVVDELVLGDDSPAAYDHHAFVGLADGHFAVPFTDYPQYVEVTECDAPAPPVPPVPALPVDRGIAIGEPAPWCPPSAVGGAVGAVELAVDGSELVEVDRAAVERADAGAERVVLAPDGTWLVLGWDRLIPTDGGTDVVLPTA